MYITELHIRKRRYPHENLHKKLLKKAVSILIALGMLLVLIPIWAGSAYAAWDGAVSATVDLSLGGGSGTQGDPYIIATEADLARLSVNVNDGHDYAGQYIKLTGDPDLNGEEWTPVGDNTGATSPDKPDGAAFRWSF